MNIVPYCQSEGSRKRHLYLCICYICDYPVDRAIDKYFMEFKTFLPSTLLSTWINFNPAWIRNCNDYKVLDEISYPLPNFNGVTVEAWKWKRNSISYFTGRMITYDLCILTLCNRQACRHIAMLLWGESTSHRLIPLIKASNLLTSCWTSTQVADDAHVTPLMVYVYVRVWGIYIVDDWSINDHI